MLNKKTMNIKTTSLNKFAWIISGLIQSDGSFGISIRKVNYGYGFTVKPYFRIELRIESLPLIKEVKSYFGCGSVGVVANNKRKSCYFEILNVSHLWHIIIPHFLNYPLFGKKNLSFINFVQALSIMYYFLNKKKQPFH
jgi:hypothetical protein